MPIDKGKEEFWVTLYEDTSRALDLLSDRENREASKRVVESWLNPAVSRPTVKPQIVGGHSFLIHSSFPQT